MTGRGRQCQSLLCVRTAGGEHDNGHVHLAGTHLPQAGHAVHKGHHDIQDHQVDAPAGQHGQGGAAVGGFG